MPEWVYIDTAVLRAARDARGLSYESTARELHISSKTWERYEKAGRVPRPLIPSVADVLGLEIEEPAPRRVVIEPTEVPVGAFAQLSAQIDERFDELEQRLIDAGLITPRADPPVSPRAAAATAAELAAAARAALKERPQRKRGTG